MNRFTSILIFALCLGGCVLPDFSGGGAAPFKADKPTFLIIEKPGARSAEFNYVMGKTLDNYVIGIDGELKMFAADTKVEKQPKWVQDGMAFKRGGEPWLLGVNKRKWVSVPLPQYDPNKAVEAMKKVGAK
jgi:hypothetical protein